MQVDALNHTDLVPACQDLGGGVRVERGYSEIFDHYPNGPMWTQGNTAVEKVISFATPFSKPPIVHLSVAYVDASRERNFRIRSEVKGVSSGQFRASIRAPADTRLAAAGVEWLAIGRGGKCKP